jgi:DNA polymerase III delta prime subunit
MMPNNLAQTETQQSVARPTAASAERPIANVHVQPNDTRRNARPSPVLQFHKATKRDARLRLAVAGPSGSGKTYTLLKLATELGGPIALVDSERGSAEKYADLFEFDTLKLDSFSPDLMPRLIESAAAQGYKVLIIDSLSHFWTGTDGELDQVEKVKMRLRDNGFAAWREITPKHNRMIDAMLSAPLHILVSMRVKTEWIVDKDERTGKSKPRKVGLQPVMRDGIEYEFDVCGEMDQENTLVITKSRCPKLAGGVFPKPGRELAEILKGWLTGGPSIEITREPSHEDRVVQIKPDDISAGGTDQSIRSSAGIPDELAQIWRRMCSPRGVAKEFDGLKSIVEDLGGSTGLAEFDRILRKHGVHHAKQFRSSQPARVCAKDLYELVEQLRGNARENQGELLFEHGQPPAAVTGTEAGE